METTKLSSKGQVIIPKSFRSTHHWVAGLELVAIDVGDGILLKPKVPFEATNLEDVAGCLQFNGKQKKQEDIELAIKKGLKEQWRDCN